MSTRTRDRRSPHPLWSSRRLAWVLALALLLPFAQSLAWTHVLSHHGTQRSDAVASALDTPCAICLSAATLHSGGLPSTHTIAVEPPPVHAAPPTDDPAAPRPAATLAYRSRAPPLA